MGWLLVIGVGWVAGSISWAEQHGASAWCDLQTAWYDALSRF